MELALRIWSNLLLVSQKAKKIYARICTTTYLVLLICQPYILIKVRAQEGIDFYINARKSFRNSIKKIEKKNCQKKSPEKGSTLTQKDQFTNQKKIGNDVDCPMSLASQHLRLTWETNGKYVTSIENLTVSHLSNKCQGSTCLEKSLSSARQIYIHK